uniref:SUEL-type lectin domain-containing protein n=1 Tax=Oreochromis niloticus TaxID=8128 RepID=A0A669BK99_ORENI
VFLMGSVSVSDHSVTCEGSQSNLQCGQVIVVSWANYGRRDTTTCPGQYTIMTQHIFADSPLTCVHRCNWQNSCTVEAKSPVDPCGGIYKYLEVFYTCQRSVTCQKFQSNLQCGQVIVVSWANYGRRDTTTCPGQYTILSIFSQMTQHIFADSPLTCVHRCNGKNSCTVEEPSSVDPCVNIYKYLEVFYTCQGK